MVSIRRAVVLLVLAAATFAAPGCSWKSPSSEIVYTTSYDDLVRLFDDWRAFVQPRVTQGVADYTPAAMDAQRLALATYQARLARIDPRRWPIPQRVDSLLVRAEMNGLEFNHRVLRPWSRNPCFYAVLHTGPTDVPAREGQSLPTAIDLWTYQFPLAGDRLAEFRARLGAVPAILEQARRNLVEDAKDLWFFGIRVKRSESRALAALAARLQTPGRPSTTSAPGSRRVRRR
jgi:hypothetical protein